MIAFDCVTIKGFLDCASFSVSGNRIGSIVTETEFDKNLILRVLTGLAKVDSGKVLVFDEDITAVSDVKLNEIRKRTGIALNNGGLISNLKLWENIVLPVAYHASIPEKAMEEKMLTILEKVGYDADDLNLLPSLLQPYKRRLAGIVRAMLMEPDLIIYDSIFDGLKSNIKIKAQDAVVEFHKAKEGRVSLFLDSEKGLAEEVKADNIFMLKKGKFYERN